MKTSKKTTILTAALSGLVLGATLSLQGCKSGDSNAAVVANEKHACAGLNSCENKGGCKGTDNSCMNKNACKEKGGCATVKHACAKQNDCAKQGGCSSGDNKCAGKNSCQKKGGCGVPVNKDHKK
jgi:hypothetical protein